MQPEQWVLSLLESEETEKTLLTREEAEIQLLKHFYESLRYLPKASRKENLPVAKFTLHKFLSYYSEGDEIWEYQSAPWTWGALCGRAGFAIIRDGKVKINYRTWTS
jgi:hypothetical protein